MHNLVFNLKIRIDISNVIIAERRTIYKYKRYANVLRTLQKTNLRYYYGVIAKE